MADLTWEVNKVVFCDQIQRQVALETGRVHPIDLLPDPPRVIAHRCDHALECNQSAGSACVWAGTNPNHDPFTV